MKKLVLKLDFHDKKEKCKVMAKVSGIDGVISVSIDMKEKKMTVTGDVDAVEITSKLRKLCHADIETLAEAEAKEKKEGGGGDKKPGDNVIHVQGVYPWPYHPNPMYSPAVPVPEDNPYPCVIC